MDTLEILQQHQLKKTSSRVAMIDVLKKSGVPLSENEIKMEMGHHYDRITFYRNVQTLVEAGVMHKIAAGDACVRYALNDCSTGHNHQVDHVHFMCVRCNSLRCLFDVHINSYSLPDNFRMDECSVVMKGVCDKCSSN